MTIRDIARLGGVSKSTVSRIINSQPAANKTKEKILRIIEKYEYYPNTYAQYLGRRRQDKDSPTGQGRWDRSRYDTKKGLTRQRVLVE